MQWSALPVRLELLLAGRKKPTARDCSRPDSMKHGTMGKLQKGLHCRADRACHRNQTQRRAARRILRNRPLHLPKEAEILHPPTVFLARADGGTVNDFVTVSYTHLTLPTNREV